MSSTVSIGAVVIVIRATVQRVAVVTKSGIIALADQGVPSTSNLVSAIIIA
jgi:hypothetical protein